MTMPNPVAEVVERLRWYARHYFSHVPRYETLTLDRCMSINEMLATAADEIERLSRERDTGVPTAAANPAACAAAPAVPSYVIVDTPKSEPNLTPSNVFPAEPASRLSAAPQPPTVSEGASSDLPDEIYVERDAETNEKRWFSCKGMGEKYVHARLLDNWKFVAKHGLAKVTPEHTWAQWLAEMKADLSTLTRERDQAREALAELQTDLSGVVDNHLDKTEGWIGRELRAKDLPTWWHKVNDVLEKSRARSVLHPDTEVSS